MRLRLDAGKIERFRVTEGLLKRELASRANIHPNQITRVLAREAVGVRVARSLASAMGVPVREITAELVEPAATTG